MTNSERKRDNSVMMSSVMPSVKYSCSGSPLIFWNGNTATEGLSGRASGASTGDAPTDDAATAGAVTFQSAESHFTVNACTGRSMFFNDKLPRSSNVAFSRPATAL